MTVAIIFWVGAPYL